MVIQMFTSLTEINLSIIGKPNSGKSTLFNSLLKDKVSPVGSEYGLTKKIYKESFTYKKTNFVIVDTPGLRRRSKVIEVAEVKRNSSVIKLINNIDVIVLLIDSFENITKQDFRLADLSISKKKIVFFLFNKIDLIEDKINFKKKINKFLQNNYDKYKMINIEFISAKYNIKVTNVLKEIVNKKKLVSKKINKSDLNKFIRYLVKKGTLPRVNNVEIKPKFLVQIDSNIPKFKVFINSKKNASNMFRRYFDNAFRDFFRLRGIPISYEFISSKNPYSN